MELKLRQQKLIEEFESCSNWEERYAKLIKIGKNLPELAAELKVDDNLVKGCQSKVWIAATLSDDKKIVFKADSDAMIVKGIVKILLDVYSNATPQEIIACEPDFIKSLEFDSHLSPSRANGLFSMIKQIKYYALAFQAVV